MGGFPLLALFLAPILAYGPMVLYALIAWWFDRFEKEPLGLIGAAFIWGALPTVILALFAQVPTEFLLSALLGERAGDAISSVFVAPFTEELFKALFVLLLFLLYRREIDSLYDGFLYGSLVGFGFAATENLFYFLSVAATAGLGGFVMNVFLRALVFGLQHAAYTSLTGLGFAAARLARSSLTRIAAPFLGLGGAMAFHALHNTVANLIKASGSAVILLIWAPLYWIGVLLIFVIALYGLFRERRWIRTYLWEEVEKGVLPEALYRECASFFGRTISRWGALLRGDIQRFREQGRLYQTAVELAFRKHQQATLGESWEPEIQRLRAELQARAGIPVQSSAGSP